jgi:hypothetical protein
MDLQGNVLSINSKGKTMFLVEQIEWEEIRDDFWMLRVDYCEAVHSWEYEYMYPTCGV